jgi:hypothetical protein
MSAVPVERLAEDPLDPERILRALPEREHENFLAAYREAVEGARDPAGWKQLRRVLRLWHFMSVAAPRDGCRQGRPNGDDHRSSPRGSPSGPLIEAAQASARCPPTGPGLSDALSAHHFIVAGFLSDGRVRGVRRARAVRRVA